MSLEMWQEEEQAWDEIKDHSLQAGAKEDSPTSA
jgi:hypothetical protein